MMKKAFGIAFLMVGMAGIGMGNTVTIPGDAWTVYDIPEGGAALQLNIDRANNNLVIDDSEIQLQDTSDTVQWSRSSASQATHVYQIGTVLSAREYLHVFGHYHYTNGVGGGGTPPTFNAKVAAPDVDIGSLTEEQEESVGVWLPKGGTRTVVNVHAVQCRSPSSSQQTLTWSSGKLSLWTAASGGSMLSGGSYALGADQGATYYAQGDSASGSIRDSEIKTAYTVSGQGTAYDKVKLTVVGATLSSFSTVMVNATNDVSVTLSPNPPGVTNTLQIVCLSGSGSAQFAPSGGTTLDIGQSGTVKIKGVTASSVSNNMLLKAVMDGTILASNVFTVIGPEAEMKSIEFTSDHNSLKKNPTSGSVWGDSSTDYEAPEWVAGSRTNPISHAKNTKITATVKVKVDPAGLTFDLIGDGPDGYVDFQKTNNASTGGDQDISVTADANLPDQVCILDKSIAWKIKVGSQEYTAGSSGSHKIYVTYGTPANSAVTEKRIEWCCDTCSGESSLTGIGDKIYTALASEPPKFQLNGPNIPSPLWLLMSSTNYQGQCIDLANLMKLQVEMLGGSGSIGYVYGSSDTTCFSTSDSAFESRTCTNTNHPGTEKILVYSNVGGGWNNWEAVCKVDDTYYAVKLDKGAPVDILRYWLDESGNYQAWMYQDAQGYWNTCTDPGPYPVPKP